MSWVSLVNTSKIMNFLQTLLQTNVFSDMGDKKVFFSNKEILLQEAQRQLLYYENQTRACLKVRHQAKGNESDLKKTLHTPLPVVNCLLKNG